MYGDKKEALVGMFTQANFRGITKALIFKETAIVSRSMANGKI